MAALTTSTFLLLVSVAHTTHSTVYLTAHCRAVVGIIPYRRWIETFVVRVILMTDIVDPIIAAAQSEQILDITALVVV